MESDTLQAPPVVAVVVVHDPGDWFEDTLAAFATQDYPNLRFLFLDTADQAEQTEARVHTLLPEAFVRDLGTDPGFGAAVNEVLRLVEGDNGLFLVCHDDIAPEPATVRVMVEELYRSNAGVVGPKLVDWSNADVLQSVGLGLDRFGEVDPGVDEGEMDQEQHDGVRDVFVVPSACMLVRADLFREMSGFDPAINLHGDDVEFCWRAHYTGARVIVAPSARVRHREALIERRPDLNHRALRARHRMRSVATLTGAARLPGRSLELVLLTAVEMVVGLFTGRLAEALASLRALGGLIPRTGSLIGRRREVKPLRRVPEREVAGLQERGSARLNSFIRSRETSTYVGVETNVRRWRESTTAPMIAWIVVIIALVIGSREVLRDGIPPVGEFLRFPDSPRLLFDSFLTAFNGNGAGATSATPTGWASLAGLSFATLFHMGMLHTLFVIGLVFVGIWGMWKLATVFPSTRARIAALLVYAAIPLVGGALSAGRLTVLVVYAASPWIIHLYRRAAGVGTADPLTARLDVADGLVELTMIEQLRRSIAAGMVVALAAAFAPISLVVALVLGVLLALGTLLALAPWRTAVGYVVAATIATAVGALLNLPWLVTWTWDDLVGAPPIGDPGRGLLELASFEIGTVEFAALSLALYIPVVAAIALARAWRLTWAVRAGVLVVAFGALAVLFDRDALPFRGPEAGVLLVPVAIGVALSSAAALAAFDLDVRGGSFGWRQPLGIVASIAVVVGLVPGVLAIGDGAWKMPTRPLSDLLEASLPDASQAGEYNVLYLGDARILPVPAREYRDGISWAVKNEADFDTRDRWAPPLNDTADAIDEALDEIANSSTLRAGRLLAPLAIRYIVVPEYDGLESTADDPIPVPSGLFEDLDDQLDLVSVTGLPTIEVFENRAWLPRFGVLSGATAEASTLAGAPSLVRADLSMSRAAFAGADQFTSSTDVVAAGDVVSLAIPYDENWTLEVDGNELESRRAFGLTTAFDVPVAGEAVLAYRSPGSRSLLVGMQFVLWILALAAATRLSTSLSRRRAVIVEDETLIHLDEGPMPSPLGTPLGTPSETLPGLDPGLDITGEIARDVEDN
ncbi:MAG: glycosyltransferase [Acidimicrobiia bacterium]|nr:glycosyltransferase [Acidimicrobiia bacterium]